MTWVVAAFVRTRRRGPHIGALLALAAWPVLTAAAQPATPEEPAWNQAVPGAVTLEEELSKPPAPADATPAPTPQPAPGAAPAETEPATPSPAPEPTPPAAEAAEAEPEFMLEPFLEEEMEAPLPEDPDVGVPSDTGLYLPDLANPMDPFFQLEGLHLRLGVVHLRLLPALGLEYNDNIFATNQNTAADLISSFTPGIAIGIGDYKPRLENFFALVYNPEVQRFARNHAQNTINQFLAISGQYAFRRLVTSANFSYSKNDYPVADQIGRNENVIINFGWDNSYALGAKTFLELGLAAQFLDYSRSIDYTTLSAALQVAYQYSPKLRIGLGPFAGITYVENGEEQPFQGINLSWDYSNLAKLRFRGTLGFQSRQFGGSNSAGSSDLLTPTFSIGANYEIKPLNTIDFSFSRSVGNSGFVAGQSQVTNTIAVVYAQPFLRSFRLAINVNYQVLQYQGSGVNDRTDDFVNAGVSIAYLFWRERCSLSIFYNRQQRISEIEVLDYAANTIGTSFAIEF